MIHTEMAGTPTSGCLATHVLLDEPYPPCTSSCVWAVRDMSAGVSAALMPLCIFQRERDCPFSQMKPVGCC